MEPTSIKLEFDSARYLHSLLGDDIRQLRYMEEQLGIKVVTRDGWLIFQGEKNSCERACQVMEDLEKVVRSGGSVRPDDFRLAVDIASGQRDGEGVSEMRSISLRAGRGRKPVTARSPRQHEYLQSMQDHDVVFGLGPAGTGKTYLAVAMALSMLKKKEVRRVILTRPAVEAGEALGFLPGDLKDKVAPYLRPLYDAIEDILDYEEGQRFLEEGIIEVAPLAYMRGRTLTKAFVILDEAQNTTREQMFMALTRLGEGSRMVVTGDASQVDLRKGESSGLSEAETALSGMEEIGFVRFDEGDVVRHPVVGMIITAYKRHRS